MAYMTRTEAMEYLHIKNKKMWQLTTARKIPFYQDAPGGRMFFDQADLDRYKESIRVEAPKVSAYTTLRKRRPA